MLTCCSFCRLARPLLPHRGRRRDDCEREVAGVSGKFGRASAGRDWFSSAGVEVFFQSRGGLARRGRKETGRQSMECPLDASVAAIMLSLR